MVCFALDPKAAAEAIRLATSTGWSVWLGSDAITQEEHYKLCSTGLRITRYEVIWVEHARFGTQT